MFGDKRNVILCFYVFVVLVQGRLTPEERTIAEKQCVEETEVDYEIVSNVKKTLIVPDGNGYEEFLHCYYKKQGFQDENGQIIFSELKDTLTVEGGLTSVEADKLLDSCENDATAPNPVERPKLVLRCTLKYLVQNSL